MLLKGTEHLIQENHVTNEDVCRKIHAAIGKYDELPTLIKKRKLRRFGQISSMSRFSDSAKTILQGTVQGKRRKGRHKKRWEDDVKEWTGKIKRSALSQQKPINLGNLRTILALGSEVLHKHTKCHLLQFLFYALRVKPKLHLKYIKHLFFYYFQYFYNNWTRQKAKQAANQIDTAKQ